MAKSTTGSDDELPVLKSAASKKNGQSNGQENDDVVDVDAADGGEGEEGDETEETFEIEKILEAKRGVFPNGRMGYFVKWKGYPDNENSWVNEEDANAPELIAEYWEQSRKGRKPIEKPPPAKQRTRRESVPADTSKKRGRKSQAVDTDEEDSKPSKSSKRKQTDTDDDEPKSAKAPANKKTKANNTKKENVDIIMDNGEGEVKSMSQYYGHASWEDLIEVIDTVENDGAILYVYLRLKTGERIRENSKLCYSKCPQQMLRFYESNLRWREAESENAAN